MADDEEAELPGHIRTSQGGRAHRLVTCGQRESSFKWQLACVVLC